MCTLKKIEVYFIWDRHRQYFFVQKPNGCTGTVDSLTTISRDNSVINFDLATNAGLWIRLILLLILS